MKSTKKRIFASLLTVVTLATMSLNSVAVFAGTSEELVSDTSQINGGVDLSVQMEDTSFNMKGTERAPKPRQVILQVPFQTQQNGYYCGPASAAMVVNTIGYNKTQNEMARLLGTTTNGTNAGIGVANALNRVVKGSRYKFTWEWHTYHQIDKMKNHVVEALSWGNPVMVNTVESPGDVYLRGHNTGSALYHYGVIGDYFNYGNEVTYVDPGYGLYNNFLLEQRVSIRDMSYATGGRGYAW